MSENLREVFCEGPDWDIDETRESFLRQMREDGWEMVRYEPIANIHRYRVFFRKVEKDGSEDDSK